MDPDVMGAVNDLADIMGVDPDVLGLRLRFWKKKRRALPSGSRMQPFRQPPLLPGQSQPSARLRSYVGMGVATWGAADATDKTLTIEPQESFRGDRLIIVFQAAGGTAAGITVLRRIEVGTLPQSPSVEQPAPAAMFQPDATYSSLDIQVAHRGTKLTVILGQTAAPGGAVTVTAVAGFYGEWIR